VVRAPRAGPGAAAELVAGGAVNAGRQFPAGAPREIVDAPGRSA